MMELLAMFLLIAVCNSIIFFRFRTKENDK